MKGYTYSMTTTQTTATTPTAALTSMARPAPGTVTQRAGTRGGLLVDTARCESCNQPIERLRPHPRNPFGVRWAHGAAGGPLFCE